MNMFLSKSRASIKMVNTRVFLSAALFSKTGRVTPVFS
jgi:hypothetical protein